MRRHLFVGVALVVAVSQHAGRLAAQADPIDLEAPSVVAPMPRVRANGDASLEALLREASERSTTFRRLVETIDGSDGIVYLDAGKCGHGVRACLSFIVRVAGPNRILRVVVDTHRNRDELLAAMGHELQHAIEALSDPHVRDYHTIHYFFDRIAKTNQDRFETTAAVNAGIDVMEEVRRTTN